MLQNLSSAAVVIGALRVNIALGTQKNRLSETVVTVLFRAPKTYTSNYKAYG